VGFRLLHRVIAPPSPDIEEGRESTPMTALLPSGLAGDLSWARLSAPLAPLALGFNSAAWAVPR
jgi:hypothetical protein